jgi:hypothetical protein
MPNRHLQKIQKRMTAWIACIAILLASLLPGMSHAVSGSAQSRIGIIAEICSVDGTRLHVVDASTDKASGAHTDGMGLEHCLFCLAHAGPAGLPPSMAIAFPIPSGAPVRPSLFFHSPKPLFAWSAGQPRAPPLLS